MFSSVLKIYASPKLPEIAFKIYTRGATKNFNLESGSFSTSGFRYRYMRDLSSENTYVTKHGSKVEALAFKASEARRLEDLLVLAAVPFGRAYLQCIFLGLFPLVLI